MRTVKERQVKQQKEWLRAFTLTSEQKKKLFDDKLARMALYRTSFNKVAKPLFDV